MIHIVKARNPRERSSPMFASILKADIFREHKHALALKGRNGQKRN